MEEGEDDQERRTSATVGHLPHSPNQFIAIDAICWSCQFLEGKEMNTSEVFGLDQGHVGGDVVEKLIQHSC